MKNKKRVVKDTYVVSAADVQQMMEAYGSKSRMLEACIDHCREEVARTWVVPADWDAQQQKDGSVVVHRYRSAETVHHK